jgi:hypothetical protein
MMKCGCVASATTMVNGKAQPCCPVHIGLTPDAMEVVPAPDLTGRIAKCYGHNPVRSSTDLAFFVYKGPGSPYAKDVCQCGYHLDAHQHNPQRVEPRSVVERGLCSGFQPGGGLQFDEYYDGCHGWN